MRITERSQQIDMLNSLESSKARLEKSLREVSSGKKIESASNQPTSHTAASRMRASATRFEAMVANTNRVEGYFQTAEVALSQGAHLLLEATTVAQQMSSGLHSEKQKDAAADSIQGMRESLLALANTKHQNSYVFAGIDDHEPPFNPNAQYQGAPVARKVEVAPGENIPLLTGQTAFGPAFAALENLDNALRNHNADEVKLASEELQAARSQLVGVWQDVGASIQTTEQARSFLDNLALSDSAAAANLTDADLVEALSQMSQAANTMQTAVQASAKTNQILDLIFQIR